ncbi:hypothetical protein BS47DRAFT_1340207 [Hydnum rufescens UP504]|uniref:Uncharacterized protein n=1 Tax=Hydnum rufescens UP504 TaxID=1448309 RepID=A0A9P6B3C2_9AGAM|nr:hypothetical protein BS47DRAFT_1340207 [Hydnum rufescens UP504]
MADEMLQAPTAPVRPQPKHWYGYISWTAQDGNTRQTREWAAFVIGREVPGTAVLWPTPGGGIILFPVRTTQETSAKIFGLVFMNEDMPRMNQAGISLSPSIPNTAGPVPPLHFPQQQQSPVQSQQSQYIFSAGQAVGFELSGPAAQQSQQLRQIFLAQEARARQRAALLFAPQNPPAGSAGGSALFPPAPLIVNAFGFNPWPPMYNLASNPGGGDLGQLQAQIRPQQEQEEHQQQQQTYAINRPQFLNDLGMPPAQQLGTWGVHHRQPSGPMQTPAENGNAGGNGSGVPMMPTAMDILQAYLASQSTGTHGPR